jgi:D-arabinose 1-dehydrogenase-like Zn-dependent alcohol dehydrogenase
MFSPRTAEVWFPLIRRTDNRQWQNRDNHPGLFGWARLKPGVTIERAQAEMKIIAERLAKTYPESNTKVGANVKDFFAGEVVSAEGHVVCGRCRNCLAGRRHLCKDTLGIGVNRPGAFAEFISVPMTNVWHHRDDIDRDVASIFDPFGNAVHTAVATSWGRTRHRRWPHWHHGRGNAKHAGAPRLVTDVNDSAWPGQTMGATSPTTLRAVRWQKQQQVGMKEGSMSAWECAGKCIGLRDMIENMAHGGKIAMLGIRRADQLLIGTRSSSTCLRSKASRREI